MTLAEWPYNLWEAILNSLQFESMPNRDEQKPAFVLYWPNIDAVISSALDERQQKIIHMRFERKMTYRAIADEIGGSSERVRQIIGFSMRRLREPQYFSQLNAIPECSIYQLRKTAQELSHYNEDLKSQITMLYGDNDSRIIVKRSEVPLDSRVDSLSISARSINCLIAHGIETVGDLIACKESTLKGFKKLGKVSIADIKSALANYGYTLKP